MLIRAVTSRLERNTWTNGNRSFDVMHVATALHLRVKTFLTFDKKQKELAKMEKLSVPKWKN